MWCSAADTYLKLLDRAVSGARFVTEGVFECDVVIVTVLQFCVCCIRSGVTRCTRLMMLYLDHMGQCGLHAVPWSHIDIRMRRLAAEPRSTARLYFPSQCPTGTILLTPYSMVWNWPVSRAGQYFFIGLCCSIPTQVFYYFSIPLSVNRLVLWCKGLRTDRMYITLPHPCTADRF